MALSKWHKPMKSLFTTIFIQDTNPLVNIPYGSRWSLRPHKWSVAVLQFQRAQLGKRYKKTTKLKHKVMRAIRQRSHTNLRVIESHHNSSRPTHTSNIRDTYATKVESSLPHTMSLTISAREDRDRIVLNTGPMTSLTITDHEKRHNAPQHGKDEVDLTRCMMGDQTGNRSTSSTSDHHQNLEIYDVKQSISSTRHNTRTKRQTYNSTTERI
jgi:hypothetical protein